MYIHTYIWCLKLSVPPGRSVFTFLWQSTKRYLPGHTFWLLLGKPQQVGQEVLLLNLLCSCVWSDILDGVHKANSPDGFKLHCLAHKNKISSTLANQKKILRDIREWAYSWLATTRDPLFQLCYIHINVKRPLWNYKIVNSFLIHF